MIKLYQKDSATLVFPVKDTDGNLITNLATATAIKFMVKDSRDDLDIAALISKSLGSGVTANSPTVGYITVQLDATDTSAVVGIKYFGVQIEYSATNIKELFVKYNGQTTNQIEFVQGVINV